MPVKKGIPLDVLQQHFHLPMAEVAHKFGHSVSFMKKICRGYGIKRWPCRKVNSMKRQLATMVEKQRAALENTEVQANKLQEKVDALQQDVHHLTKQGSGAAAMVPGIEGQLGGADGFEALLQTARCLLEQDTQASEEDFGDESEGEEEEPPSESAYTFTDTPESTSMSMSEGGETSEASEAGLELSVEEMAQIQQRMNSVMRTSDRMHAAQSTGVSHEEQVSALTQQVLMMMQPAITQHAMASSVGHAPQISHISQMAQQAAQMQQMQQAAQLQQAAQQAAQWQQAAQLQQAAQQAAQMQMQGAQMQGSQTGHMGMLATQMQQAAQLQQQAAQMHQGRQMMQQPQRLGGMQQAGAGAMTTLPPLSSILQQQTVPQAARPAAPFMAPPMQNLSYISQLAQQASQLPGAMSMGLIDPLSPPPGSSFSLTVAKKKPAAPDKFNLRKAPMQDGSLKGWHQIKKDELINMAPLAAVAEWWEVQEVRGYQIRPRQLGVLADKGVVLVNQGKFKWYRPSGLFASVFQHPAQQNMLTVEYKVGSAGGFVATAHLVSNLLFSSPEMARTLRTRLAEIHIQQLAGQSYMDAEMETAEMQLESIEEMAARSFKGKNPLNTGMQIDSGVPSKRKRNT